MWTVRLSAGSAWLFSGLYERSGGASWQEANFALQQIMTEYADCGPHRLRSDTLLTAASNISATCEKKSIRKCRYPMPTN